MNKFPCQSRSRISRLSDKARFEDTDYIALGTTDIATIATAYENENLVLHME